jgi:hypothetical protein
VRIGFEVKLIIDVRQSNIRGAVQHNERGLLTRVRNVALKIGEMDELWRQKLIVDVRQSSIREERF